MYKNKKVLAIIPARGGSKGLPGKNIKNLCGKPLIAWSIEAALATKFIDRVIVSTDNENIATIAKKHGASVPFIRPQALGQDDSSSVDVIQHSIQWLNDTAKEYYDIVVLLQPTSPLRDSDDIENSIKYYFGNRKMDDDTLVSVTRIDKKYGWLMKKVDNYGSFYSDMVKEGAGRQTLEDLFLPNGAIYIAGAKDYRGFFSTDTLIYEMPECKSIDIDTEDDFNKAKNRLLTMMEHLQS